MISDKIASNYYFHALSISFTLKKILSKHKLKGVIQSVYRNVVNFTFGNHMITAADFKQRNLPYGFLCDFSNNDLEEILKNGDIAEINSDSLIVKRRAFEISLISAVFWSPKLYLPLKRIEIPQIRLNMEYVKGQILKDYSNEGLILLIRYIPQLMETDSLGDVPFSLMERHAYDSLCMIIKGIRDRDNNLIIFAFERLVGLGFGLTPSGDDILMGLFAALIITSDQTIRSWIISVYKKAFSHIKELTNDVSLNYLNAIRHGYYPERFSNLISRIIKGNRINDIQPSLNEMCQWGGTSGCEIIIGLLIGLSLSIEFLKIEKNSFVEN